MRLEVTGEVWFWRGPAPHHFLTVPEAQSEQLQSVSAGVSYGWGMIPVTARIGGTTWTTSLFPKDGLFALPLKADVRRREGIDVDDVVTAVLTVDV